MASLRLDEFPLGPGGGAEAPASVAHDSDLDDLDGLAEPVEEGHARVDEAPDRVHELAFWRGLDDVGIRPDGRDQRYGGVLRLLEPVELSEQLPGCAGDHCTEVYRCNAVELVHLQQLDGAGGLLH